MKESISSKNSPNFLGHKKSQRDFSVFLEYIGNNPRMRLIEHLIEGKNFDYSLTDLLNARVSWGTINSLVPKLLELGIIKKTRKVGRATLYKINKDNIVVKHLIKLYNNLIMEKLDSLEKRNKVIAI